MSDPMRDPVDDWLRAALTPAQRPPAADDGGEPIDDGRLATLRRGELSPEEAEAIERRLADDREARLLAAAQVEAAEAPAPLWAAAALPRARRARVWQVALAATVLIGAGIGLWQSRSQPAIPIYGLTAIEGQVRAIRADPDGAPGERPVFTPDSRIRLSLAPPSAVAAAPPVAVFVAGSDGTLSPVPAQVDAAEGGGLTLSIAAGQALGQRFGEHRLHIALGPADHAGGRTPGDARDARPETRWIEADIVYRAVGDEARP